MTAIYKRELKAYMTSMIGPLFIAALTAIAGVYFVVYNLRIGYPYFSYVLGGLLFIFLLIVPVLTMRSLADERKSKTDQLLLTSPVSVGKIIMGKYFAMITIMAIPVLIFCLCPLVIKTGGTAYLKADYASLFAFFLMGCAYISIGMFISSLTESQIIAAVGTFGVLLFFYLLDGIVGMLGTTALFSFVGLLGILAIICLIYYGMTKNWMAALGVGIVGAIVLILLYVFNNEMFESALPNLLSAISINAVIEAFINDQVFDVTGLVYYISISFVFLFLSSQMIQKRRWS